MKRILAPLAASVAMWLSPPVAAQSLGDVLEASILTGWHREDGKHVAALHIDLDRFTVNDLKVSAYHYDRDPAVLT